MSPSVSSYGVRLGVRDTVIRMQPDRKHRRIVGHSAVAQDVRGPERLRRDRERRRPEAADRPAGRRSQDFERPEQVRAELVRPHERQQAVGVAVRRDLVTPALDLPDQIGKPLRHPAEHEKRGLDAVRPEDVEQAQGRALDSGLARVPRLVGNPLTQVVDAEPVLHVHRHHVLHARPVLQAKRHMPLTAGHAASGPDHGHDGGVRRPERQRTACGDIRAGAPGREERRASDGGSGSDYMYPSRRSTSRPPPPALSCARPERSAMLANLPDCSSRMISSTFRASDSTACVQG